MNRLILKVLFISFFYTSINAQKKDNIDEIFKMNIEDRIISRGDNFRDFSLSKENRDRLQKIFRKLKLNFKRPKFQKPKVLKNTLFLS